MHLEVHSRQSWKRIISLVTPTSHIGSILATKQSLDFFHCLLVHSTRGCLTNRVVRIYVKGNRLAGQANATECLPHSVRSLMPEMPAITLSGHGCAAAAATAAAAAAATAGFAAAGKEKSVVVVEAAQRGVEC